jgi:hypothetical protein
MNAQTKKGLIITGVITAIVFVAYKILAKKPTYDTGGGGTGGGNTGGGTGGNTGGGGTPPIDDRVIVGKRAVANKSNVYVRKNAEEYSNVAYNNIIGVLAISENAGTVSASAKDKSGNNWYSVNRGYEYDCPFMTCGFTFSASSGWVKASDVNLS